MADSNTTLTQSVTQPGIQQKLAAEAIGTFVLVFFGCGSVVYSGAESGFDTTITTIGLTFGIAVMVMVYAFGRVSGGHFNPAVSVGAAMGGRLPWNQVGLYVVAQLVGAFFGALALFVLMQGFAGFDAEGNMGQNYFGDQGTGYAWWAAFLLEMLLTAVFVLVILAVTDERNEHPGLAPLTIGLTLAAIHFVAIPATGTSVNPARSIGPALFAGGDAILQLWLFIVAPLLGGAVAGLGYPMLFGRASDPVPGSGLSFARPRTAAQVPGYTAPDQFQQQWNPESSAVATEGTTEPTVEGTTESATPTAPIIQDGWQWDPVGQQWHPVGQTPEQWREQQAAEQRAAEQTRDSEDDPQHQWPEADPGDGGTQIRPPGQ